MAHLVSASVEANEAMKKVLFLVIMLFCLPAVAKAAELNPALRNAQKAIKNQKLEEALKYLVDAQIDFPHDATLSYHLGEVYYKMERYQEAEEAFTRAMRTDNKKLVADSLYNLGNTTFKSGKLKESIEYFTKALDMRPDDEDTKYNLDVAREVLRRLIEEQKKREEQQQQEQQEQDGQCNNPSPAENGQNKEENGEEQEKDQETSENSPENQPSDQSEEGEQNEQEQDSAAAAKDEQNQNEEQNGEQAAQNKEENSASLDEQEEKGGSQEDGREEEKVALKPQGEPTDEEDEGSTISRREAEQALKRLQEKPPVPQVSGKKRRPAKDW